MKYGKLIFANDNFVMVKYYLETNDVIEDYAHQDTLNLLEGKMLEASVVEAEEVPIDVVQIYSTVRVHSKSGWEETFDLVPPCEANINNDKISVISSLGAKIIGLSEGDFLQYGLPGNIINMKIEKVVQDGKRVKLHIP